jgi:hypothetical protein
VLFNYRYNPVHWKVEEVIASGKIGNVKSVHFEWLLVCQLARCDWHQLLTRRTPSTERTTSDAGTDTKTAREVSYPCFDCLKLTTGLMVHKSSHHVSFPMP